MLKGFFLGLLLIGLGLLLYVSFTSPKGSDVQASYRLRMELADLISGSSLPGGAGRNVVMMRSSRGGDEVVIKNPRPDIDSVLKEIKNRENLLSATRFKIIFKDQNMNYMREVTIHR